MPDQTVEAGADPFENGCSHQREIAVYSARIRELMDRLRRIEVMAEETIRTGGRVELHPEEVRSIASGE